MKSKLLIIIALVGFLSLISIAQAVPMLTFDDAYDYSELVIVGQIESVEILSEPYMGENRSKAGVSLYDVTILFSLKNPDNITEITVPGEFLRAPHAMAYETYPYDVGQVVVLFIQPDDFVPGYDLVIRSGNSAVIYPAVIYPNGSVGDGCEDDRYSYYQGYCMRTEIQNQNLNNRHPENRLIRLTVSINQETYKTGELIKISGNTGIKNSESLGTITVLKPDETIVTSFQMMPNDEGIISYYFKAGIGNMDVSGKYTIEFQHDGETIFKQFSFNAVKDVIQIKTIGDDAPFFGIFVYLDNLISWIMGK